MRVGGGLLVGKMGLAWTRKRVRREEGEKKGEEERSQLAAKLKCPPSLSLCGFILFRAEESSSRTPLRPRAQ